jgi:hypothetical protein
MTIGFSFSFVILGALLATAVVQATTRYIIHPDRLVIKRAGFIWMTILFRDIREIEHKTALFDRMFQIKMYQLASPRKMIRITKSTGFFQHVLLNPKDANPIFEAFHRSRALPTSAFPGRSSSEIPAAGQPERLSDQSQTGS